MNYARLKTIQLKQSGKLVIEFKGSIFNVFLFSEDTMNSVCMYAQRDEDFVLKQETMELYRLYSNNVINLA